MIILLMICFTVAGCSKKTTVKVVDRNDIYNIEEIIENSEEGSGFKKVNNDKYYLYDVDNDGLDEVLVSNYKFINGTICYYIDCYNSKKDVYYEISDLDDELEELIEFVDIIDEDLSDLEDFIYDEDFEDEFDEFECPNCGTVLFVDEDDFDEKGNMELVCPECNEEYVVTDDFGDCCCEPEENEE